MFFRKKFSTEEILSDFLKRPHKLTASYRGNTVSSSIIKVNNNELILSEFDPIIFNKKLRAKMRLRFKFEIVYQFKHIIFELETYFMYEKPSESITGYFFKVISPPKQKVIPYRIIPDKKDNCSISFEIKRIPQFKKVEFLTEKTINFHGTLRHYSDYFGKILYDIELKLPLKRLRISGVFKQTDQYNYYFEKYIVSDEIRRALWRYAEDNFVSRNGIITGTISKNDSTKKFIRREKISNEPKKILIVDDKKAIIDIIEKYIVTNTDYKVEVAFSSEEIFPIVKEDNIILVLLDDDLPDADVTDVISKIRDIENDIPIIITTNNKHISSIKKAKKFGATNFIQKPVDSKELIRKIKNTIRQFQANNEFELSTENVLIASEISEFNDELAEYFSTKSKNIKQVRLEEQIVIAAKIQKSSTMIIHFPNKEIRLLSLINTIRRAPELKNTCIIVVTDNEKEISLLEVLEDSKIIIFSDLNDVSDFETTLDQILEVK